MRDDILDALSRNNRLPTVLLAGTSGGRAILLPHGGRVLALFAGDYGESLLWVNPRLFSSTGTEAFFEQDGWKNFGGDRTWLGPEHSLFIQDLSDPWNTYRVPAQVDPGQYSVEYFEDSVKLTNAPTVVSYRLLQECAVKLTKTVRMIPNPLRAEIDAARYLDTIDYVGYEQRIAFTQISANTTFPLDIWNLMQVPAGGEVIIPTLWQTVPRDYLERTGETHLATGPRAVWFKIDARQRHKISIRAAASTGRAGYIRPLSDGSSSLIVRSFAVNPSGEYVDTPFDQIEETGYAVQCYNDAGNLGDFGEIEYHSPAIGGTDLTKEYVDYSQVWAFRGSKEAIRQVCTLLLGATVHWEAA